MKLSSRVVWSEGMYLGPHHFQAQNRYYEDSVRFALTNLWFERWGLIAAELDTEALANGTVALRHAAGMFRDGLTFSMPDCDSLPPPRKLGEAFSSSRENVTVSLAIAPEKPGGMNCALTDNNGSSQTRYTAISRPLYDEITGGDEKPVMLGRKNIRLAFDAESDGTMFVPVARVVRDSTGRFGLDPRFVPPCLRISASERLMALGRKLIEILEAKAAALRSARQSPGKFQAGWSPGEVATFWFLHAVHSSLAPLRHICLTKRGHPEELYSEMARLAGALCTFGVDSDPLQLPLYDHEHLGRCFDLLDEHIRRHLEIVVPTNAIRVPLKPAGRYFYEGDLTDQRCFGPSRWIFGVQAEAGEADIIRNTPVLVKICSAAFIPELVRRAMPGLALRHLPQPPSAISPRVESQYFAISKAEGCWDHIRQTRRVGVYIPGDFPNPEVELVVVLES